MQQRNGALNTSVINPDIGVGRPPARCPRYSDRPVAFSELSDSRNDKARPKKRSAAVGAGLYLFDKMQLERTIRNLHERMDKVEKSGAEREQELLALLEERKVEAQRMREEKESMKQELEDERRRSDQREEYYRALLEKQEARLETVWRHMWTSSS
ncbi:hypothetical protein FA95DRAFT_1383903 [Auriscalpium vulgare]|uniref:Uncharacterized protein n=1 Tax=Auriscalpium vulgare TaxID=40419 RepID=A0ACB8S744_9AGAM|nr:hypothetical protein FA95DRAFT_1383903 [Auriscalpium vulgare]